MRLAARLLMVQIHAAQPLQMIQLAAPLQRDLAVN